MAGSGRRQLALVETGSDFGFVEGDFEELLAGCGAADEDNIAWRKVKRPGEDARDGGVRGSVGGWSGHGDVDAAVGKETFDGIARRAWGNPDCEKRQPWEHSPWGVCRLRCDTCGSNFAADKRYDGKPGSVT